MSHEILKRFRIRPGLRHVETVGVAAYMRCNLGHLKLVNGIIRVHYILKVMVPVKRVCNASILVVIQKSGIPALQRASISLPIVLLDTSKCSASSGAVIISFCNSIDNIPINLSIFICSPFLLILSKQTRQQYVLFAIKIFPVPCHNRAQERITSLLQQTAPLIWLLLRPLNPRLYLTHCVSRVADSRHVVHHMSYCEQ